ncbi:MAG TPA: HAMP domain-containing sensor histidine kinase [Galbitalea sp.]|jgi:signal transduction histidine kinase
MNRSLSIRTRITLGSAAVALVVIVIAIFGIRINAESTLHSSDLTLATTDLASFQKDLAENGGAHVDAPGAGILVLIRDPHGRVAVSTLPDEVRRAVESKPPSHETFSAAEDGSPYVVVARTVSTRSGTWALWAARSTASSRLVLAKLDAALIVGGLLALIAFSAASWLLTSVALRPVTAMRRRAQSLSGTGENERLPVGSAGDELAGLAATLNDFLDRVHDGTLRERRMVSDAAHELRTPLAALRTQLELAHDDFGNADALANEIIGAENSVARLTALANGLLELSRLEGEDVAAGQSTTSELIDETMGSVDRARMLALAKQVDVAFAADDLDDRATYPIEPDAFARILDNLLSNAVNAVGVAGSVELSLRNVGSDLELAVRDDGPGVPEGFLPKAFDRFSRPDESRTASQGGSGLGLALVRAIAESAGGTAAISNGPIGASATVRIPKM